MAKRHSSQPSTDSASKDAIRHRAAREIIEKVEGQIAEEEQAERDEKPGRLVVRTLVGILLLMWIVAMTWIAIKSIKKREVAAGFVSDCAVNC